MLQVWNDTQYYFNKENPKRVYYLSMEFLMGRSLLNALFNLNVKEPYTEALRELGYNLEDLIEQARPPNLLCFRLAALGRLWGRWCAHRP